ncbi:MAG: primosomal protein N' [Clostridia bacterium]|nr:primosomal protein N' [Clostridia bacterium]
MEARYAQVVVDVPARRVDKCYDYIVPEDLHEKIVPGCRVMVPFGQRSVEGFVVGRIDESEVDQVREIIGPVAGAPPIPEDLIDLARWMSETYICLLVDALRVMLPSGTRVESSVVVHVSGSEEEARAARLTATARRVFDYLVECGGAARRDEIGTVLGIGDASRQVAALVRAGLVETEAEWMPPKVRPRTVRAFRLSASAVDPESIADELAARSPAQAGILRALARAAQNGLAPTGPAPIPRADLLRQAGCSSSALDALVRRKLVERADLTVARDPAAGLGIPRQAAFKLAPDQERAVDAVVSRMDSGGGVVLVHGVTSSGKTEVYLKAIEHALSQGKQAILLVPDISLTPQMADRVMGRFGRRVAVLHSALGAGERLDEWERIRRGEADVVVGARSAVFAPVKSLGVIIIDEEHDSSYKQDDSPRYHAREVARFRAERAGATVVLGSATPSIESYRASEAGHYSRVEMPSRIDDRPLPSIVVVDMRAELKSGNRTIFSRSLRGAMQECLAHGRQAILFMNRRGYSTFVLCRDCGYVVKCPNCEVSLTYHAGCSEMVCHYCGHVEQVPTACPSCGGARIRYFGAGTERIEEEARSSFPDARVARMDVDTTRRKGAHRAILEAFGRGNTDILVGTQMIAKGLDFPNVTVVGVVSADTALNLPDFRAAERTFQLISQVAGRSGRGEVPGTVFVQTYNPGHYSISKAACHDYRGFYEAELAERESLGYPPVRALLRILIAGPDESQVVKAAGRAASACAGSKPVLEGQVEIVGPAPAPISRIAGKYRWHVLLLSGSIAALRAAALPGCEGPASGVTIALNTNPESIL